MRALPVVVSTKGGACCLSLVGPRICWRVGGTREIPVEALLPQGRESFEVAFSSGWSGVLGIDAVGGPPHRDFANEGGARVASGCSPDWLGVTLAGVILDMFGEVGDQLGSPCQIGAPDGMVLQRGWNAREPGQRTWVGRRELWEAPGKDGGHIAGGAEVTSEGGCQHVAERLFTGFGRQREQVGSQGRPGRVQW